MRAGLTKTPVIEVRDLVVQKGASPIIVVPHLAVQEGEVLAIIGPNGAGKSTLLGVLGLLEPPTAGEVIFRGQPLDFRRQSLLPFRRRLASVFQEPLLCDTTLHRNVALGLKLRGIAKREVEQRVARWLSRLGIAHLRDRQARTLSGGEAQRASLARAFILDPDLLLLDEPFAALDPPTREALLADLGDILAETNTTTVFVTHDRDEALALGDRVAVMMGGKILQLDAPERVFSFPQDEEVARFVGVETILPGRVISVEAGLVVVDLGKVKVEVAGQASPSERVLVCLRPEDIALVREEGVASSVRNCIEGRVVKIVPTGFFYRVVLDCGVPLVALITKRSFLEIGLEEGLTAIASFKATAAHLIRKP